MIMAKGKKTWTLYIMQAKLVKEDVNVVDDSSVNLWHMRLSHISEKGLETLARKNLLSLKERNLKKCTYCFACMISQKFAIQLPSFHEIPKDIVVQERGLSELTWPFGKGGLVD